MGDHAIGALLERREFGREAHLDVRMRLRHCQRFLDDLDALALQHVGKAGVFLEMDVIERGDELAMLAVPVMKNRRDDPARLDAPVQPDAVEHFKRRRMVASRPRYLIEKIMVAELLDQRDPHVRLRQRQ